MSEASETFENSIRDAEELLEHFNNQPKPPPPNAEVLKRAGLVLAIAAWETYVEDRVREEVRGNLPALNGSHAGKFMQARLNEELKRFHNPAWDKTRKIFMDFVGIDVTAGWKWAGYQNGEAKSKLNELLSTRGEIVHRAKPKNVGGLPRPHLVKKQDLAQAIRFLKGLVKATDKELSAKQASN